MRQLADGAAAGKNRAFHEMKVMTWLGPSLPRFSDWASGGVRYLSLGVLLWAFCGVRKWCNSFCFCEMRL